MAAGTEVYARIGITRSHWNRKTGRTDHSLCSFRNAKDCHPPLPTAACSSEKEQNSLAACRFASSVGCALSQQSCQQVASHKCRAVLSPRLPQTGEPNEAHVSAEIQGILSCLTHSGPCWGEFCLNLSAYRSRLRQSQTLQLQPDRNYEEIKFSVLHAYDSIFAGKGTFLAQKIQHSKKVKISKIYISH